MVWRMLSDYRALGVAVSLVFAAEIYTLTRVLLSGDTDGLRLVMVLPPLAVLVGYLMFRAEGGNWGLFLVAMGAGAILRPIYRGTPELLLQFETIPWLVLAVVAYAVHREDPSTTYYVPSVLARMRAKLLPPPDLLTVPLGTRLEDAQAEFASVEPSDGSPYLGGCEPYVVRAKGQEAEIDVHEALVVGVIYATDLYAESEPHRLRKLEGYLRAHGRAGGVVGPINNGSAFLYPTNDDGSFGAYAYGADVFSIYRDGYKPAGF